MHELLRRVGWLIQQRCRHAAQAPGWHNAVRGASRAEGARGTPSCLTLLDAMGLSGVTFPSWSPCCCCWLCLLVQRVARQGVAPEQRALAIVFSCAIAERL